MIRIDNRDSGQSTNFESRGNPPKYSVTGLFPSWSCPKPLYTTVDMAKDSWAILDALAATSSPVHLFGFSMGGAIISEMLLLRPHLVKSFTPAMSSTFSRDLPFPSWQAIRASFNSAKSHSYQDLFDHKMDLYKNVLLSDDAVKFDPKIHDYMKEHHTKVLNHSTFVKGTLRQMNANALLRDREPLLRKLSKDDEHVRNEMKVFILQGEEDKVVKVPHGERWKEVFPSAKLRIQKTMGHFFEPRLWNEVVEDYVDFVF